MDSNYSPNKCPWFYYVQFISAYYSKENNVCFYSHSSKGYHFLCSFKKLLFFADVSNAEPCE